MQANEWHFDDDSIIDPDTFDLEEHLMWADYRVDPLCEAIDYLEQVEREREEER